MNLEDCENLSSPIKKKTVNVAEQPLDVLGLKWDYGKDTLVVCRGVDRPLDKAKTQRTVLSFVSSVFDPVGLIAPYTVRTGILLKDIWKISGRSWHDELPEDTRKKFLEWHSGLPLFGQVTVPHCFIKEPMDQFELHVSVISRRTFSVRLHFCMCGSPVRTKLNYPSSFVKLALHP